MVEPDLRHGIAAVVGSEHMSDRADVLLQHGRDESRHPAHEPDLVVYPTSTAEVAAVITLCAAAGVPVVPFGAGTSLEGGVAALRGGVSLDLSQMDRIIAVSAEDLDVAVQPGVTRVQLNQHVNPMGLQFPVDPGANATLGGMAATAASGTTTVRYGGMRDHVLGLEVVLGDGRVVRTGGRARKSSAGYDLTKLFVGSEGTLGVITELTLRLHPLPPATIAAVARFGSIADAVNVVIETIQSGIPVARIELLDAAAIGAVNRFDGLDLAAVPTLFLEFQGLTRAVAIYADETRELVTAAGGTFEVAESPERRAELWHARHRAYYAAMALRPGAKGWPTDVAVPISRLAEAITATIDDLDGTGLTAPLVGHVGDGNFHLIYVIDPEDAGELSRAAAHYDRMVERALALGGTCTGEHGIGFGKREFLRQQHPTGVDVMAAIKASLDPNSILNPGKIVDPVPLFPSK